MIRANYTDGLNSNVMMAKVKTGRADLQFTCCYLSSGQITNCFGPLSSKKDQTVSKTAAFSLSLLRKINTM